MNTITWNNHNAEIKSGWGELSRPDFLFLADRFPFTDTPEFHVHCFNYFMNLAKWGGDKRFWKELDAERLYDVLINGGKTPLFKFLLENPVMEKALWTKIIQKGRYWHGPSNSLADLTFGEFRYAEDCLAAFLRSKASDALDTFIAVLWRPGFKKPAFSMKSTDSIALKAADINLKLKYALVLQYIAMRGYVMQCNAGAFDTDGSAQEEKSSNWSWGMLISALAPTITDVESIENMPLWTALEWISNQKHLKKNSNEQ